MLTRKMAATPQKSVSGLSREAARPQGQKEDTGYALPIRSLTLTATIAAAAATDELSFLDPCGILDDLDIGNGADTQSLDVTGKVSASTLKNFLQTYKMKISEIVYDCQDDSTQVDNNINFYSGSLDARQNTPAVFDVSTEKRNTQQVQGLQVVYPEGDAWLTNMSGIVIATASLPAATKKVSITLKFSAVVPY